jgi:hypothetical protein
LILKLRCKDTQVLQIIRTFVKIILNFCSMLIYNITFLVSESVETMWLNRVKHELIPFMVSSGHLSEPQHARILADSGQEGISYSLQFKVENMETLSEWHNRYSDLFAKKCEELFQQEVLFFSTVLELIP